MRERLAVVVPWYPKNNEVPKFDQIWTQEGDTDLMRYGLQYDATFLLTEAVTNFIANDPYGNLPNSQDIVDLLSRDFPPKGKIIGVTGELSIENHERVEKQDVIVQPQCDSEKCQWTRIEEKNIVGIIHELPLR